MLLGDEASCDPRHAHVTTSAQRDRFRRALRRAREEAGLSQRALARAVGRTHGAAWQWEEGRGAPDPATVARLYAEAYEKATPSLVLPYQQGCLVGLRRHERNPPKN